MKNWLNNFIKEHIICVCPYPNECFDCNLGNDDCYTERCNLTKKGDRNEKLFSDR
jgi:hypothetical protein